MLTRRAATAIAFFLGLGAWGAAAPAQIAPAKDAPQPRTPAESATCFRVPDGFRMELLAAEPLIREPTHACWDAHGRLFVCELHGYNLEGHLDVQELNKSGELDRKVRRIPASEAAMRAAEREQYGTVKRLIDRDGDGRMDASEVWADRLPPCLGICPARDGLIVVCAPDILYLADRDGDGKAEVREKLYTGFRTGLLERRMNSAGWGLDNWIYVARGRGGRITGPGLKEPVDLPATDFRIKADGSAIEPISGGTYTQGMAFTESGDRLVASTASPGVVIAPLAWHYLARNRFAATQAGDYNGAASQEVYPTSRPHPWRVRRAEDPGFAEYYSKRYGKAESQPNGYFTSACSPLVYVDSALPGLGGHLLACEPAQNFVHRARIDRHGVRLALRRPAGEEQSEFLTSSDIWFHPIALELSPAGDVVVVDFYREIIEDYSAIPRYLQQQYGLVKGENHGRLWRLTHDDRPAAPHSDMAQLSDVELAREVAGELKWRRTTARRLLLERNATAPPVIAALEAAAADRELRPAKVINALYTLEGLDRLSVDIVRRALAHENPQVQRNVLPLAERFFDRDQGLFAQAAGLVETESPSVRLQLALSLGESQRPAVVAALARLVVGSSDTPWMADAVLSSAAGRGGRLLTAVLAALPAEAQVTDAQQQFLRRLCGAIAARKNPAELSASLEEIVALADREVQRACLEGMRQQVSVATDVDLSPSAETGLKRLAMQNAGPARAVASQLMRLWKLETPAERKVRLAQVLATAGDVQLPVARRLAAVREVAADSDPAITEMLLAAYAGGTPQIRQAILAAAFARRERLTVLLTALEEKKLPVGALDAVQRLTLLEHSDADVRARAAVLLEKSQPRAAEMQPYLDALQRPADLAAGEEVFRKKCATCHHAHGVGTAIGPSLTAEFRRAPETMVQDILDPSSKIEPSYTAYGVETTDGRIVSGLLALESASSITLKLADGKQATLLRSEIEQLRPLAVSFMPDQLGRELKPADVANVIAWLRRPSAQRVLFDDDPRFLDLLTEGDGKLSISVSDKVSGAAALQVTPLQRHAVEIPGWKFPIRENPGPGEYRYLRFAWKSTDGLGVMIELANAGRWPPAGDAAFRYVAGKNTTAWQATQVSPTAPREWTIVTRDLWKDFGDSVLTGIAPTALGGPAMFDRIELLPALPDATR